MFRIDVADARDLQAVVLALKVMPRDLKNQVSRQTRAMAEPAWREELRASRPTRLQSRVLVETGRVSVTGQQITLKAGTVGRVRRGVKAANLARPVEFGADGSLRTRYTRRYPHTTGTVTRKTRVGLDPIRAGGKVVYPALARFVPRAASLWVQTCVRMMQEAFRN